MFELRLHTTGQCWEELHRADISCNPIIDNYQSNTPKSDTPMELDRTIWLTDRDKQ